MKKVLWFGIGWALMASHAAFGGPLYGTITVEGKPASGAQVAVACQGRTFTGRTDARGRYTVRVEARGRCSMRVNNGPGFDVFVSDNPIRFDARLDRAWRML